MSQSRETVNNQRCCARCAVLVWTDTHISKECVGGYCPTYDCLLFLQHGVSIFFYLFILILVYADVAYTVYMFGSRKAVE